jgi:heat shock protein HslJ
VTEATVVVVIRALGLAVVCAMVLAAGCSGDDGDGASGSGRSTSGTTATSESLDGRFFLSTEVHGRELVVGTRVELAFEGSELTISAGCNMMGGDYSITDGILTLDGGSSTLKGCADDRMAQDRWLEELLRSSPTISGTNDGIVLQQGETLIVLADRTITETDRPLVGTQWRLETIIDGELASSVPAGVDVPTLLIGDDQAMIFTGCNNGGARVDVARSILSLQLPSYEEKACGLDATATENTVMAVLQGLVSYELEGNELTLTNGQQALVYRAA